MSGGADVAYWAIIGIPILAAALCAGTLVLLLPWLKSYALAQPVDRSLHREPTPQGGGLGVVLATLIAAWLAVARRRRIAGGRARPAVGADRSHRRCSR